MATKSNKPTTENSDSSLLSEIVTPKVAQSSSKSRPSMLGYIVQTPSDSAEQKGGGFIHSVLLALISIIVSDFPLSARIRPEYGSLVSVMGLIRDNTSDDLTSFRLRVSTGHLSHFSGSYSGAEGFFSLILKVLRLSSSIGGFSSQKVRTEFEKEIKSLESFVRE